MAYIGIKVTDSVKKALDTASEKTGRTKSDLVREAVESHLIDYFTTEEDNNWKIVAWNFLGLDAHKIGHAMSRADTAEEFFSYIAKWVKSYEIRVHPTPGYVVVSLSTATFEVSYSVTKSLPKERIIANIVEGIEQEAREKAMEDI